MNKKYTALLLSVILLFSSVFCINVSAVTYDEADDACWAAVNKYFEMQTAYYDYIYWGGAKADIETAAAAYKPLSAEFKKLYNRLSAEQKEWFDYRYKLIEVFDITASDPMHFLPLFISFGEMTEYSRFFTDWYIPKNEIDFYNAMCFIKLYDKLQSKLNKNEWDAYAFYYDYSEDFDMNTIREASEKPYSPMVPVFLEKEKEFWNNIFILFWNDLLVLDPSSGEYADSIIWLSNAAPGMLEIISDLFNAYNGLPAPTQTFLYNQETMKWAWIFPLVIENPDYYIKLVRICNTLDSVIYKLPWEYGDSWEIIYSEDKFNGSCFLNAVNIIKTYDKMTESEKNFYYSYYHAYTAVDRITALKKIIRGDINRDGAINGMDLLLLKKQILGSGEFSEHAKRQADVNYDGKINGIDLLYMKKCILSIVEPLKINW